MIAPQCWRIGSFVGLCQALMTCHAKEHTPVKPHFSPRSQSLTSTALSLSLSLSLCLSLSISLSLFLPLSHSVIFHFFTSLPRSLSLHQVAFSLTIFDSDSTTSRLGLDSVSKHLCVPMEALKDMNSPYALKPLSINLRLHLNQANISASVS